MSTVLERTALSAAQKKTVAERAREICEFDSIDHEVFVNAGLPRSILVQLSKGRLVSMPEFTHADLKKLATAIGVFPKFLLRKDEQSDAEKARAMSAFETGVTNDTAECDQH